MRLQRSHAKRFCQAGALTILILSAWIATPHLLVGQEFPADVTRGKSVYERHCQGCHGRGGWGDGPDAAALMVRPTNFHLFRSYLKSDDELQRVIEYGVVFSPMHAWQGQLTESEIQDVLAHIRLLSQQGQ